MTLTPEQIKLGKFGMRNAEIGMRTARLRKRSCVFLLLKSFGKPQNFQGLLRTEIEEEMA